MRGMPALVEAPREGAKVFLLVTGTAETFESKWLLVGGVGFSLSHLEDQRTLGTWLQVTLPLLQDCLMLTLM